MKVRRISSGTAFRPSGRALRVADPRVASTPIGPSFVTTRLAKEREEVRNGHEMAPQVVPDRPDGDFFARLAYSTFPQLGQNNTSGPTGEPQLLQNLPADAGGTPGETEAACAAADGAVVFSLRRM